MTLFKKDKINDPAIHREWEEFAKVREHLMNVTFFRGNLQEYESWKGYQCEIISPSVEVRSADLLKVIERPYPIDSSMRNTHFFELKQLCDKGIEAVINLQRVYFIETGDIFYGLPVKKK